MGSKSSKSAESPTKVPRVYFTPSYEVKKKYIDVHFGEVSLVTETQTQKDLLLKKISFSTKDAFEAELQLCEKRIDYAHANENIITLIGYNFKNESKFCSDFYKINIFLEVIDKTLVDVIQEAEKLLLPFTEVEILFLAENLISCLSYFQTQGINHGNIQPINIFATESLYKLADPTLAAQKNSNALAAALVGEKSYLAPEQLKFLSEKKLEGTYDKFKADVFAVGMTLLGAATLTQSEELYNYELGTLDNEEMEKRLLKIKGEMSEFTYKLIRDMLSIDSNDRPDFVQLEGVIAPFREVIKKRTAVTELMGGDVDEFILRKASLTISQSQELRAQFEQRSQVKPIIV